MVHRLAQLAHSLALLAAVSSVAAAATLEVPTNGGDASGVGYFSGWKCPPNGNISIVVDGGAPIAASTGVGRGDTAGACGNDGRNGYITQINFNLLGEGQHTAVVRQNGVPFAQSTFRVATFGRNFLTGASGKYTLQNFPQTGQSATIEWSQGAQNFIIVGTGGTPPPATAQVRFLNDLVCNGGGFQATLTANGFTWASFSGVPSPYQPVNRSFLGFFVVNGNSLCTDDFAYNFTLPTPIGRRIVIVQSLIGGTPGLVAVDEGPVTSSADTAEIGPALRSDESESRLQFGLATQQPDEGTGVLGMIFNEDE